MSLERIELVIALLLSAIIVFPLLSFGLVPTVDGFHHILHGVVGNHFGDVERGYSSFLEAGAPITALGFGWIYGPLESLLGWQRGFNVALAAIALGWAWSVRFVIRSVAQRPTPLGLLGFCFAFNWPLYMGFLPFCVSGIIGLSAVGIAARPEFGGRMRHLLLATLLLVCALAHVFPAVICGLLCVAVSLATATEPKRELVRIAASGLPAATVALMALGVGADNVASQGVESNAYFWLPLGTRLADIGRTSIAGPLWRWGGLLCVGVGGALLAARKPTSVLSTVAAVLGLLLVAGSLFMPLHMTAWEYFSPRPLLFGLAMLVAACGACLPKSRDRVALVGAALMGLASLLWGQSHNQALEESAEPALAALQSMDQRNGWRLPIVFDVYGSAGSDRVAYAKPLSNIGLAYAAEQGGMVPYLFASSPEIHPHVFLSSLGGIGVPDRSYYDALTNPEWAAEGRLDALRNSLMATGSGYQDVIVWGDPDAAELLAARGFTLDHQSERLAVARFEGCNFSASVVPQGPGAAGSLQWGWFPLEGEAGRESFVQASDGTLEVDVVSPCGPTWFRVAVAVDGSTFVCDRATPDGRVLLDVVPDMTFTCPLTPYVAPTL